MSSIIPEYPIDANASTLKKTDYSNTFGSAIPSTKSTQQQNTGDYVLTPTTRVTKSTTAHPTSTTTTSYPTSSLASTTNKLNSNEFSTHSNTHSNTNIHANTNTNYTNDKNANYAYYNTHSQYPQHQQQQYYSRPQHAHHSNTHATTYGSWFSLNTYLNMLPPVITENLSAVYNYAQYTTRTFFYETLAIWNAYPALRTFTYVFTIMCSIPLTIFSIFAAVSTGICVSIALITLAVVEGAILGFGLLCLSPFLFFSFWSAVLAVGAFAAVFYGLRLTTVGLNSAQRATGLHEGTGIAGSAIGIVKHATALGADVLEKVEEKMVGPEGLPYTLSGRM